MFFLYFRKGIFRTLVYLQLEAYLKLYAYSEHCQKSLMECSVKHSYLANFPASALKRFPQKKFFIFFLKFFFFLIFKKWNFLVFRKRYIQNPGIFRIISIFRTGGIFSDCETSTVEHFVLITTYHTFTSKLKK